MPKKKKIWVRGVRGEIKVGDTVKLLGASWPGLRLPPTFHAQVVRLDSGGDPWVIFEPTGQELNCCAHECKVLHN